MEKKCGKKYLLSLRDSLHIKRALSSIRLKRKTRRERESKYTIRCSSSSMFFGLKLRCCRSKKTTLGGGWIPYVPPPEDNFSCHVSQVRFLCSIGRDDDVFFDDFPPPEKTDWKMIVCGCALLFVFLSSHTHLVLCVVNNKCLLSLDDDDDDEDRSR